MRISLLVVSPCAAMSKCSRTEGNRLLHIKCLLIFLLSHSAFPALCQQRRKINIVNMQMNLVRLVALELRNFVISLLLGVPFLLTENSLSMLLFGRDIPLSGFSASRLSDLLSCFVVTNATN